VPQTIEDAAMQVLRGTVGVANEQMRQRSKAGGHNNRVLFFPVVVTTARLFPAEYSTDEIDIASGTIAKEKVTFGDGDQPLEQPWVLLNYPASESLALAGIPDSYNSTNPADLKRYKCRSIYIVNAKHLVDFFTRLDKALNILP
jgi:hypothetical protein